MLYYFPTIKRDLLVRLVPTLPALVQVENKRTDAGLGDRTHAPRTSLSPCQVRVYLCQCVAASKTRPTG